MKRGQIWRYYWLTYPISAFPYQEITLSTVVEKQHLTFLSGYHAQEPWLSSEVGISSPSEQPRTKITSSGGCGLFFVVTRWWCAYPCGFLFVVTRGWCAYPCGFFFVVTRWWCVYPLYPNLIYFQFWWAFSTAGHITSSRSLSLGDRRPFLLNSRWEALINK